MSLKLIGSILIIVGCGGFGFAMTAAYKREETALRQLIGALDYMQCELQYRMTPLPDLCRQAGLEHSNPIGSVLRKLSDKLENHISPDVSSCMESVLSQHQNLPKRVVHAFELMGSTMGRFDAAGQIRGLEAVRAFCRGELDEMAHNRDNRLRSYQTLGLCTGAALAILFV